jgi:hypothetical protein
MPPHQLPHRSVAGDAAQQFVFFPGHRNPPAAQS